MAVSKRLRFEVFRRDNHSCRYCGAAAPEAKLTVDHVVPVALGGNDDPSNLVTACSDCNGGKSSMPADATLIDDVAADAQRWASAMKQAVELRAADRAVDDDILESFECAWTATWLKDPKADDTSSRFRHPGRSYAPRPADWERSILNFISAGLEMEFLVSAKTRSLHNERIEWEDCWRYFCGICWRELDIRREIAASLLKAEDSE